MDVYMVNSENLAGFQIWFSGVTLTGASGGLADDAGFNVNVNESMILGFSLTGESKAAGEGELTTISYY